MNKGWLYMIPLIVIFIITINENIYIKYFITLTWLTGTIGMLTLIMETEERTIYNE